jgi:hypothetical protein
MLKHTAPRTWGSGHNYPKAIADFLRWATQREMPQAYFDLMNNDNDGK